MTKKTTTLSIDHNLIDKAKEMGINMSALCNEALKSAVYMKEETIDKDIVSKVNGHLRDENVKSILKDLFYLQSKDNPNKTYEEELEYQRKRLYKLHGIMIPSNIWCEVVENYDQDNNS